MKENFWIKTQKKIRDFFSKRGYTCDGCGVEVFDYPTHRICAKCEKRLSRAGECVCSKCGRKTVTEGVCMDCKSNLPKFTRGFAPFVYRDELAAMINRMKNGTPRGALYLGEQMAEYFVEKHLKHQNKGEEILLIPVPITKNKRLERGYNQSERLAESLCERLVAMGYDARVDTEILEKRKETAQQKQMGYVERMQNASGAYHVHKRKACKGKEVVLIDDIMTTGATASECAARLLGAGAKEVYFLAAAAVIERR